MSEIQTDNKEKLAKYMKDNNLEVLNNTQLSAILMKHEELLKQVLAFASDNLKATEERIKYLETSIDRHIEDHVGNSKETDRAIATMQEVIDDLEGKVKILELGVSHD